jgi:DNA-binding NarL/FixJ family response regulator
MVDQVNLQTAPRPRTSKVARVLVVDDHPAIRHGLVTLVDAEDDLEVCGQADTFQEGLASARALRPDVIILDLSLPDTSGMELIKAIKAELPFSAILVVSVHDESKYALRALLAGALGYIMKADAAENVLEGVRKVLNGEIHISPKFSGNLILQTLRDRQPKGNSPVDRLSPRELEILELMGQAKGTREIASQLNMSPKTVETHRGHMKEKLGMQTTGELLRFALDWVVQQNPG